MLVTRGLGRGAYLGAITAFGLGVDAQGVVPAVVLNGLPIGRRMAVGLGMEVGRDLVIWGASVSKVDVPTQ